MKRLLIIGASIIVLLLFAAYLGEVMQPYRAVSAFFQAPMLREPSPTPLFPIFVRPTDIWDGEFYIKVAVAQDYAHCKPVSVRILLGLYGNNTVLEFARLSLSYDDYSAPVSPMTLNGCKANYISTQPITLPTIRNATERMTFVVERNDGQIVHFILPLNAWGFYDGQCTDCKGIAFGNGAGAEALAWPTQPYQFCAETYHSWLGTEECTEYKTGHWMLAPPEGETMGTYLVVIVIGDV